MLHHRLRCIYTRSVVKQLMIHFACVPVPFLIMPRAIIIVKYIYEIHICTVVVDESEE